MCTLYEKMKNIRWSRYIQSLLNMLNVIAQCQAFSKIMLVYTEFSFAMAYTAKVNSVKVVVSSYMHSHCAITKIFAVVKTKKIYRLILNEDTYFIKSCFSFFSQSIFSTISFTRERFP